MSGGYEDACEQISLLNIGILVVDDEADARDLVRNILESCHATIRTAQSALEAREMFEAERPHVIVCDIGMPMTDGYAFIREVRELPVALGGECPAIALTAFAQSEDRMRAMIAGYNLHLAKPIEPRELIVAVASLCGRTGSYSG